MCSLLLSLQLSQTCPTSFHYRTQFSTCFLESRLRILRDTGTKLREFGVDESHGGPHEIRPVFRSGLLKALEAGVASERIHFGVNVVDARSDADGAHLTTA